jgi:hypothetical protein
MGFLYLRKLLTIFVFKGVGEEVLYGPRKWKTVKRPFWGSQSRQ